MKHRVLSPFCRAASFAILSCSAASSLGATTVLLSNDGFPTGGASYQSIFVGGEMAASTLGPLAADSFLQRIDLLFGPVGSAEIVTLHVYVDAGVAAPGTPIHSTSVQLTPADAEVLQVDLTSEGIILPAGNVRVAIEFGHSGLPCVARDSDGTIQAGRNWIYSAGSWFSSDSAGLTGDWVIRAVITVPPELFTDGFESSDFSRWSTALPGD